MLLLLFALVLGITSCSDKNVVEDSILPGGENGNNNGGESVSFKSEVCIDWTANQDYVMKHMQNDVLLVQDNGYMSFSADGGMKTAYSFKDNLLVASVVMIPADVANEHVAENLLSKYQYVGDIRSSRVYICSDINTMAAYSTKEVDSKKYCVVGFTPINSEKYETILAPKVSTGDVNNITTNGAILTARVENVSEQYRGGFQYSTDSEFADSEPTLTGMASSEFTNTLKSLKMGTKYYYRACIVVDDVYYYGETRSFTTERVPTYAVGDFYPNSISPEGVVFYTTNEGQHGKIVSFDTGRGEWDIRGIFAPSYGCTNTERGLLNDIPLDQPFGRWVKNLGSGWYGPARGELQTLSSVILEVNNKLQKAGRDKIEGSFWSSTENSASRAYVVFIANTTYMGVANGKIVSHTKSETNAFIAVKKF